MSGLLPPHDLDAERAVLSALLLDGEALALVEGVLTPAAMFDRRHRRILAAIVALAAAGSPIDAASVAGWLKEQRPPQLLDAGGVPYLADLLDNVGVTQHVGWHAEVVARHARSRADTTALLLAVAQSQTGSLDDAARAALLGRLEGSAAPQQGIRLRSGADIAKPLPRIPWLCKALAIGPGRATILGGYGGVGKTFAAQALALAVASGQRLLWGCYPIEHPGGAVLHLDYEQGQWITDWRYQRLAWSQGIDLTACGERIQTSHYPDLYLTADGVEKRLEKLCAGKALVLIDSLRAACPGVDENDSKMGSYLMICARVSERTGATVVVVHHEGKTNAESPKTGIERLRGSSAIAAGAGTVLSFVKDPGGPGVVRIEHTRANLGQEAAPELIRLLDQGEVDDNTGKSLGISLEWMPKEQVRQEATQADDSEREGEFKALCSRVLACIGRNRGVAGAAAIARLCKMRDRDALDALKVLAESGAVENRGRKGKSARWHVVAQPLEGAPAEAGDFSEAAE